MQGWSSSGQSDGTENCICSQMLLTKRDSKELQDVEEDALSPGHSFPHAGNQTTDL